MQKKQEQTVKGAKYWEGVGRRKESVARVRIYDAKEFSKFLINGQAPEKFFDAFEWEEITKLFQVAKDKSFGMTIIVKGGGRTGWKDAIKLGLARALVKYDPEYRAWLKAHGYLRRDPRAVERKKAGLKKARKAPRFSKR